MEVQCTDGLFYDNYDFITNEFVVTTEYEQVRVLALKRITTPILRKLMHDAGFKFKKLKPVDQKDFIINGSMQPCREFSLNFTQKLPQPQPYRNLGFHQGKTRFFWDMKITGSQIEALLSESNSKVAKGRREKIEKVLMEFFNCKERDTLIRRLCKSLDVTRVQLMQYEGPMLSTITYDREVANLI